MFKFLKPAKPGGSKSATPKPKTPADLAARPTPKVRPPSLMTPLSPGNGPAPKPDVRYTPERPMTPERAQLIQNALSVHRSQQTVFDELTDEARQKLILMAMLTLLKEARGNK